MAEKKPSNSESNPTTDPTTTGLPIRQGKAFSIGEASPDDPIFTRGFVIGGRYPNPSSNPHVTPSTDPAESKPSTGLSSADEVEQQVNERPKGARISGGSDF